MKTSEQESFSQSPIAGFRPPAVNFFLVAFACVAVLAGAPSHAADVPSAAATWQSKIHPRVLADTAAGQRASAVILLAEQADLGAAYGIRDADARGWYVYRTLKAHAARTQATLRGWLRARGVHYRAFWAANMLVVDADRPLIEALAARADTRMIESNASILGVDDPPLLAQAETIGSAGIEWGVSNVNAPALWAMGYTGQGIVIAVQDSGMQWDHPALQPHYRGWNSSTADHNYNWHDAIHDAVGNPCGNDALAPCDDHGHGTHTTGTTCGDDGLGNQIGVAPGARWIGCRNMDRGFGTPARYTECFQFFIAPTDQNGSNPDPTKRPHVMNNSWGCPPSEGCAANTLETIVSNAEAAGIFVVGSAGNSGPGCGSVNVPPAIYASAFSVGAYDNTNTLAGFSSRGPVTVDSSNRMKPEIAAPGVDVRSAYPINTYTSMQGTSMAGPHVVGVVALLWSAQPQLARDIATTKAILESTANPSLIVNPPEMCGGISSNATPNNSFGYGRIDALAALNGVATPTATATSTPSQPSATPTVTRTATPTPTRTATVPPNTPTSTRTPTAAMSPPVNDRCSGATNITANSSTDVVATTGCTTDATDPYPSCSDMSRARSVWHRFTAPSNGRITANTYGSSYHTILSAFTGACGAFTMVPGACNDNTGLSGSLSQISFNATAGTTYYFMVSSYTASGGTLSFNFTFQPATPTATRTPTRAPTGTPARPTATPTGSSAVPNDLCSTATTVMSLPYSATTAVTAATTSSSDPTPSCGNRSRAKSVWYRYTPTFSRIVTADTFGSNYDTILSLYTGSCGALQPVLGACNDNANGTLQSRITFTAWAQRTYYFMVTSSTGSGTTSVFNMR